MTGSATAEKGKTVAEYIDKWSVVNRLIDIENEFQRYKPFHGFEHAMYRKICETEIAIGKTQAADVEPVQEWISVDDRLPEIGRSVIAYNAPAKCAAEAMYKGEGRFLQFRWSARLQEHEVTHWMPLPDPPKGE